MKVVDKIKSILWLIYTFFFLYKRHISNPYIRYCRRCGDEQHVYSDQGYYGREFWLFPYVKLVDKCLCHIRNDEKAGQAVGL